MLEHYSSGLMCLQVQLMILSNTAIQALSFTRLVHIAQALKTIEKKGLASMAAEAGVDLAKLPYTDISKNRLEYLASRQPAPPLPRKIALRRMQNPEKLAASRKKPLVAKYVLGNRVVLSRSE